MRNRVISFVPVWLVYSLGFLPAIWLFYLAFTGGLGADPAVKLERELGEYGLKILVFGLAVTPLWRLTGVNLVKYRRAIGLLAFAYVTLHLAAYMVFVQQFKWAAIIADIWKRPYITIGFAGFLLLLPLAITSNGVSIRKLGAATWKKLHRLVYVAVPLGALHFIWLVKGWQIEPFLYAGIIGLLLALRHPNFDFRTKGRVQAEPRRARQT